MKLGYADIKKEEIVEKILEIIKEMIEKYWEIYEGLENEYIHYYMGQLEILMKLLGRIE